MVLEPKIRQELEDLQRKLEDSGDLRRPSQLAQYYATFRERFGPERLGALDGEALLNYIHLHANHDSLVYWLEFKNDEEFPNIFGSIAGGSALKFGIYRSVSNHAWMSGSPTAQKQNTIEEAVQIARRHRDELVLGAELLEHFPQSPRDDDYARLQAEMDRVAPTISNLSWGHKYFSLLYPRLLDDYHNENYGRFHLIKLLQMPVQSKGRYVNAGRFVALAHELDLPINHLTTLANRRDGEPHRYWRINTSNGETGRSRWQVMRDGNCVAIGWPRLGNLSNIADTATCKDKVEKLLAAAYPRPAQEIGRARQQICNFITAIKDGDVVLASDGVTVFGVGRVTGPYQYAPTSNLPHCRPVEWLSQEEWKLPEVEGLETTVHQLKKYDRNLIEVEGRILYPIVPLQPQIAGSNADSPIRTRTRSKLTGILGRIESILERKGQVILYGPPGTGKTYWAERAAQELAARANYKAPWPELSQTEMDNLGGTGRGGFVRLCSFHPSYGYEDFIEGYRPQIVQGQLGFTLRSGIFKQLCMDAEKQPQHSFYLIIDEINRGDIPRIFGELLTILEKNKRGKYMLLPLSGEVFHVPANVYVIGTMNTADRSIALLDAALRRRFGFIEIMPDSSALSNTVVGGVPLGAWLDSLNRRIVANVGRDARNLQVGHSYLLEDGRPIVDFERFTHVVRDEIIPLLEEYSYEDFEVLHKILGSGLVDLDRREIRHELLDGKRPHDLVQALLALDPDIVTSHQAMVADPEAGDAIEIENRDQDEEEV